MKEMTERQMRLKLLAFSAAAEDLRDAAAESLKVRCTIAFDDKAHQAFTNLCELSDEVREGETT